MSERILKRNLTIREKLYEVIDNENYTLEDLKELNTSFGTKEWSDISHNINNSKFSCPNGCKYCYIKTYKNQELKVSKVLVVDKKKVKRNFKCFPRGKVVMFATAHDIFPSCTHDYLTSARNILKGGHELLVVSKPRIKVMRVLCRELEKYKDRVEFRFTICTDKPELRELWEKWAPKIEERIECLKYCHDSGFKTSVSIEPMLSDPTALIEKIDPYVSNSYWIGFMNHLEEIDIEDIHKQDIMKMKDEGFVYDMIRRLRVNPKVFWKESVVKFVKQNKKELFEMKKLNAINEKI